MFAVADTKLSRCRGLDEKQNTPSRSLYSNILPSQDSLEDQKLL